LDVANYVFCFYWPYIGFEFNVGFMSLMQLIERLNVKIINFCKFKSLINKVTKLYYNDKKTSV